MLSRKNKIIIISITVLVIIIIITLIVFFTVVKNSDDDTPAPVVIPSRKFEFSFEPNNEQFFDLLGIPVDTFQSFGIAEIQGKIVLTEQPNKFTGFSSEITTFTDVDTAQKFDYGMMKCDIVNSVAIHIEGEAVDNITAENVLISVGRLDESNKFVLDSQLFDFVPLNNLPFNLRVPQKLAQNSRWILVYKNIEFYTGMKIQRMIWSLTPSVLPTEKSNFI